MIIMTSYFGTTLEINGSPTSKNIPIKDWMFSKGGQDFLDLVCIFL